MDQRSAESLARSVSTNKFKLIRKIDFCCWGNSVGKLWGSLFSFNLTNILIFNYFFCVEISDWRLKSHRSKTHSSRMEGLCLSRNVIISVLNVLVPDHVVIIRKGKGADHQVDCHAGCCSRLTFVFHVPRNFSFFPLSIDI